MRIMHYCPLCKMFVHYVKNLSIMQNVQKNFFFSFLCEILYNALFIIHNERTFCKIYDDFCALYIMNDDF